MYLKKLSNSLVVSDIFSIFTLTIKNKQMAELTQQQMHSLLIEWLSDELIDIKQTMKELDLIDFWSDEQADLYEELEYRKEWIKTQIKK